MRAAILLIILCTWMTSTPFAQDFAASVDAARASRESAMTIEDSTTTAPPKRKLMPDNLSIMESAVWGENGILRSTGIASPLTLEVRKSELSLRRTMLVAHQLGGFTTMAMMLGAVYTGQRSLDGDITYVFYHQGFVAATIATYSLTALLSILSPPPIIRRDEPTSTTAIHKTLAWIHVAGMILTPLIGSAINRREGYNAAAHFHQVAAYVTTAVFATALIVVTL